MTDLELIIYFFLLNFLAVLILYKVSKQNSIENERFEKDLNQVEWNEGFNL